jgi:hypothetical protein
LSPRRHQVALAFAEALLPGGRILDGAGPATVARFEHGFAALGTGGVRGYRALLDIIEYSTLPRYRSRFSRLARQEREAVLERWLTGAFWQQAALFVLGFAVKNAHFDDPELFAKMGCVYDRSGAAAPARWMQQVYRAEDLPDEEIECDAVVVGTGAGGAVVAKELAEAGLAVVMVEEGAYFTRRDFTGRSADCMGKLYRHGGRTLAIGNAVIPIPLGRTVGGTTTVNSGTCFRTPDWVLERWRDELGLREFTPEHMAPYFDKVERELKIEEAKADYLGGAARVIARGCDKLGWSHHALRRNAPECDGQGVCMFGCPTDAKRSTNVSYVPMALERAAMLITGLRAERVLLEGGRAAGIEGLTSESGRRLRLRARAVVLACGALITPAFLLRQRLLAGNRHVGRHLTIHPAVAATALFNEELRAFEAIPQGYCVNEFHREGILLEGSTAPFDSGAVMFNLVGRELVEIMEQYDRVASFGAMVSEPRGAGRVRILPGGRSLIEYWVSRDVRDMIHEAMVHICEIFFAAGAARVFPGVQGIKEFRSASEVRDFAVARVRARDFIITAYHPLGTCRIAPDPDSGVLDPDHEAHGLSGLYVCDGSAVPTSPAVNPQVTIMAMATRAAERIARRLR